AAPGGRDPGRADQSRAVQWLLGVRIAAPRSRTRYANQTATGARAWRCRRVADHAASALGLSATARRAAGRRWALRPARIHRAGRTELPAGACGEDPGPARGSGMTRAATVEPGLMRSRTHLEQLRAPIAAPDADSRT